MSALLVIIADRLSALVEKGEISPRYYNPGDVFDDVHVLMINDDRVDPARVQPMAGRARLFLHNLPPPSFGATLGWRPALLKSWTDRSVRLAEHIKPQLIRCYAPWLNALAGVAVKRRLGAPLVISIHINADDVRRHLSWSRPKDKLFWAASAAVEKAAVRHADVVLPVYDAARRFAERLGARRTEVVYNAVNADHLTPKTDYRLNHPPRVISVGRQFDAKNPEHVIRASAAVGASITLVGSGPRHEALRRVAADCRADATFITAVPNEKLCASLASYDVFATHSEYWEISKAVLEALLAGLPVVLNRRRGEPVAELADVDYCQLVENTTDGYAAAFRRLFSDDRARRTIGEHARAEAIRQFDPRRMEARVAAIYRTLLQP